ncbi:hypothetical protein EXE46_07770 [Halorubrum sp. GN11_10-6_MGM]|uniref:Mov34/MPN/PAD-1 family protein n=1 Tax=Halorubrum sp. GN11_10-6_MGM TaxID=2518112 RepID=UPI0010F7392E|nr:Mov34/MPN/PAD-1 family protein [Halorubrum sp. GN11_10-6_MGM]TKX74754.1 hypothetical protein EXE46_07770 [Halorubrum sp. GN11_10-6_MGM]
MSGTRDSVVEDPTVIVPRPELDTIRSETAADRADESETGGVLIGRRLDDERLFCVAATRPGPNAEHRRAEFSPDVDHAQSILDDYRTEYDVVWIGTWHKHPGEMNRLSDGDVAQMREFVRDPETVDEIVAIVTTYVDGVVKLNPFYMDQTREWRRVDVEFVDGVKEYESELRRGEGVTEPDWEGAKDLRDAESDPNTPDADDPRETREDRISRFSDALDRFFRRR